MTPLERCNHEQCRAVAEFLASPLACSDCAPDASWLESQDWLYALWYSDWEVEKYLLTHPERNLLTPTHVSVNEESNPA